MSDLLYYVSDKLSSDLTLIPPCFKLCFKNSSHLFPNLSFYDYIIFMLSNVDYPSTVSEYPGQNISPIPEKFELFNEMHVLINTAFPDLNLTVYQTFMIINALNTVK